LNKICSSIAYRYETKPSPKPKVISKSFPLECSPCFDGFRPTGDVGRSVGAVEVLSVAHFPPARFHRTDGLHLLFTFYLHFAVLNADHLQKINKPLLFNLLGNKEKYNI
jgi:hypothetical protein